jgi:hypothetical protein
MAVAAKTYHYFVVNQNNQSADRRGPFVSEEAAMKWADKFYNYPAWIIPALPTKRAAEAHRLLDENGVPIQED